MRLAAAATVAATLLVGSAIERNVGAAACSPADAKPVPRAGSARADIDGDGARDRIWIGRDRGCWFVVARTRGGLRAAALRQGGLETTSWDATSRLPRIGEHADVDGRPGAETFVVVDGGASTTAYGLFSVRGGHLVRLRKPHGEFVDAFFDGGSGNRFFGFGCPSGGLMVQGGAAQEGNRYSGSRDVYRLAETTFRFVRHTSYRNLSRARFARLPELSRRPFARCAR